MTSQAVCEATCKAADADTAENDSKTRRTGKRKGNNYPSAASGGGQPDTCCTRNCTTHLHPGISDCICQCSVQSHQISADCGASIMLVSNFKSMCLAGLTCHDKERHLLLHLNERCSKQSNGGSLPWHGMGRPVWVRTMVTGHCNPAVVDQPARQLWPENSIRNTEA